MKIKCPACAAVLNVPDSAAGKVVKCPCGKQLRAPGFAAAKPASPASPGPTRPAGQSPGPSRPAPRRPTSPAGATGGFDAAMFDELTDQDLRPVASAGRPQTKPAPAPRGGKLLQQYAPSPGEVGGGSFRRGPLASPWIRLGAVLIDSFVIGLMVAPVLVLCMYFLIPLLIDVEALQNAENLPPEQQQALAAQMISGVILGYGVSAIIAYSLPITLFAVMITKTGQTPGKKLCGIRILMSDTGELPGFVHGVLLRSWLKNLIYSVPIVGSVFAIVDVLFIFNEDRRCLHDRIAGTTVVES